MHKCKFLSVILAVVLLFSVIPVFNISADEAFITDAKSLKAAAQNGGEYTVSSHFPVFETVEVKADLTLNLKADISFLQRYPETPDFTTCFKISGATLTINNMSDDRHYSVNYSYNDYINEPGTGCLYNLVGVEGKNTKLVLNDISGSTGNNSPWKLFECTTPAGAVKPQIVSGAYLDCEPENFLSGDCDLKITGGTTTIDPTPYLSSNHRAVFDSYNYEIIELSSEYSDAFKKNLDADGNFIVKRYHPSLDNDYDAMFIDFDAMFSEYGTDSDTYYMFRNYNKDNDSAIVARVVQNYTDIKGSRTVEYHEVNLKFVYDAEIKQEIDKMIEGLPQSESPEEEHYWYVASDVELVNYWLSGGTDASMFVNFTSGFRKAFDYKNYSFKLDPRLGGGGTFETAVGGIGLFMQNGTVYGSGQIGAEARHILYVPSNTANTVEAKKAAVQKKLDDFIGKGKITVKEATVWESILYMFWNWDKEMVLEVYPNATFEQYKNAELEGMYPAYYEPGTPEYEEAIQVDSGLEGVTGTTPCFVIEMNGQNYYFMVECDSSKIVDAEPYKCVDTKTNVTVSTNDITVPLDTSVEVEKLEKGAEYEKIIGILNVDKNATYDIKLYSETAKKYITKLDNGKFEVKLPVPQSLEGKELMVYYVDSSNNITEYAVTVNEGFATFETDHFSIYTLAEKKADTTLNKDTVIKEFDGAELEYGANTFPENTDIKIEKQTSGEAFKRAEASLKGVVEKMEVFEITATSNNVFVQPNGTVKVRFDIPAGFDIDKLVVYYVDSNGKYEKLSHTVDKKNNFAEVELKHFSTYVLAESVSSDGNNTEKSPNTGNNSILIYLLAVAFIGGVISIKKIKA